MSIPSKIVLNDDQEFPVVQTKLRTLGRFDRSTGQIDIHSEQDESGKHIILLHEMLHFVAETLVQSGVLKKQPPEAFIGNIAPILLTMLVRSGMYNGLTADELDSFFTKHGAG